MKLRAFLFVVLSVLTIALGQAQVNRLWVQLGTGNDDLREGSKVTVAVFARGRTAHTAEVARGGRWADRTSREATIDLPWSVPVSDLERIEVRFAPDKRFGMEDDKWWFTSFNVRVGNARGESIYGNASVAHKFESEGSWSTGVLSGFRLSSGTIVSVEDESGRPMVGARVFVGNNGLGVTNSSGQLTTGLILNDRSEIVAKARVHESGHHFGNHAFDSTQNWNYRVYLTNLRTEDTGALTPEFRVSGNRVTVTVRRNQVMIGVNLTTSVEWDIRRADEPYWRSVANDLSDYLYNATDGQFFVERFRVVDQGRNWDDSDFRVYADWFYRANVQNQPGGFLGWNAFGSSMKMSRGDDAKTYAHEFGHFGLDVRDEYKDLDDSVFCSVNLDGSGAFAMRAPQASCMMWDQWRAGKICSNHSQNMHRGDNRQGTTPCWDQIVSRYARPGSWQIINPSTRPRIPATVRMNGRNVGMDYMRPIVSFDNVDRTGLLGPASVWVYEGSFPAEGALVSVSEAGAGGRTIFQGAMPDIGALPVDGLHRNDVVTVQTLSGQTMTRVVTSAGDQRFNFPASAESETYAQLQGGGGGKIDQPQSGVAATLTVACLAGKSVRVLISGQDIASLDSVRFWPTGKSQALTAKTVKQGSNWLADLPIKSADGLVLAQGKATDGRAAVGLARVAGTPPPTSVKNDVFGPGGHVALHGVTSLAGSIVASAEAFVGTAPAGWKPVSPLIRLSTDGGANVAGCVIEMRGPRKAPDRGGTSAPSFAPKLFMFDPAKSVWSQVPGQATNRWWQMVAARCPGPGMYVLMRQARTQLDELLSSSTDEIRR